MEKQGKLLILVIILYVGSPSSGWTIRRQNMITGRVLNGMFRAQFGWIDKMFKKRSGMKSKFDGRIRLLKIPPISLIS